MTGAVRGCVPLRMVEELFYALGKGCMIHWLWLNVIGFGGWDWLWSGDWKIVLW